MGRFNANFINANKAVTDDTSALKSKSPYDESSENIGNATQIEKHNQETTEEKTSPSPKLSLTKDNDDKSISFANDSGNSSGNDKEYQKIDVNLIEFAKDNPFRRNDNSEAGKKQLEELANNIAIFGLTTPLLVNKINGKYILISGERRLHAVKMLGWKKVDCMVTEITNQQMSQGMLFSANIMTRNISTFDMFSYIYELMSIYSTLAQDGSVSGGKYKYIADNLNISKRQLFKYTSIMNNIALLTEEEIHDLKNNELSVNKAYNIIKSRKADAVVIDSSQGIESTNDSDQQSNSEREDYKGHEPHSANKKEPIDGIQNQEEPEKHISQPPVIAQKPEEHKPSEKATNNKPAPSNAQTSVAGDVYSEDELNLKFIELLFNHVSEDIPIYEAQSLSVNKKIHGVLLCVDKKRYIVYPSAIQTKANEDSSVLSVSFKCFAVDKESIIMREDEL